jgi:hypothetical protein
MASDVLSRTPAGVVFGNLFLQVNGLNFPDARWTDSVVVVLYWWCQAVLRLLQGEKGPIEVRYMEGPFLVEIRADGPAVWHLALVDAGLARRIRHRADIEASFLVHSILDTCDRALAACRRQGWSSTDVDRLATAAASLRKEMKRRSDSTPQG